MPANIVFDLVLIPIIAAFYAGIVFAGYLAWQFRTSKAPPHYRQFSDYQIRSMLQKPPSR